MNITVVVWSHVRIINHLICHIEARQTEKSQKLEGKFEGKSKRLDPGVTSDKIYYVNFAIEAPFGVCGSSLRFVCNSLPFGFTLPSTRLIGPSLRPQTISFIIGSRWGVER